MWEQPDPGVLGGVVGIAVAESLIAVAFHAASGHSRSVRVLDAATGERVADVSGGQTPAWSPDAARPVLAVPEPGARPTHIHVYQAFDAGPRRLAAREGVGQVAWSPDGARLAAAAGTRVVLWDTQTWRRISGPDPVGDGQVFARVAWSPDGRNLAAGQEGLRASVIVWDTETWRQLDVPAPSTGRGWAPALTWSPDSTTIAVPGAETGGVELWEVTSGRRIRSLPPPEPAPGEVWAVRWSPTRDVLATTYQNGLVVCWELRPATRRRSAPKLPFGTDTVLRLGLAAARARLAVPLVTLTDLFGLLADRPPDALRALRTHRALRDLRSLRWPSTAMIGIVTLLAAGLPENEDYRAPAEATPDRIGTALRESLAGAAGPAVRPELPYEEVQAALDEVDDRTLTLLTLLGADSVSVDPTLPLRLRDLRRDLWVLNADQRRLLSFRTPMLWDGRAEGSTAGGGNAGLARHGNVNTLLPTQLAVPELLAARYLRGELLYRTKRGGPPPAPRATVILLDDTPAAHGQVGITVRCLAQLLVMAALERGHGCVVVPLGPDGEPLIVKQQTDLAGMWATSSVRPPDIRRATRLARASMAHLADPAAGNPRVVLLTHPFLPAPAFPELLTVHVHYPGMPVPTGRPDVFHLGATPTPEAISRVILDLISER